MEAFSFLKYWKPSADGGVPPPSDDDDDDQDGPFFDLEFTLPDQNQNDSSSSVVSSAHPSEEENDVVLVEDINNEHSDSDSHSDSESVSELKFTLSPSTNNDRSDHLLKLVSLDLNSSQPHSKPPSSSLLKSATKFRVFTLGLKKSKQNDVVSSNKDKHSKTQRKLFAVKFKVEEVPIVSLFANRDSKTASVIKAKQSTEEDSQTLTESPSSASDEKRLQKYLKMVKPLYVRVSRRRNVSSSSKAVSPPETEKVKREGDRREGGVGSENVKGQKQGNLALPSGLRVVCKHLGKSRSASSTAVATSAPVTDGFVCSRRRDDSLLQQQDGIQGAILHCKRSFNA